MPAPSISSCHNLKRLAIMTSASPPEDLSAFPGERPDPRSPKEQIAAQLEPVTDFLAKANISPARFPQFSTLQFHLDVGLHRFGGGVKQAKLGDVPCDGAADRLDEILCGIAISLLGRKIEFAWIDMNDPWDKEDTTEPAVLGGDEYLARLLPKLAETGMIENAGMSDIFPE